eukprot:TRINITY_DN12762_c0_g1_i1.p1 TRINITY_DN12762_c0_g1~~TRINITY_DN12762_c0_g1_i1.p1  ORF type:complete len:539 (+),score=83.03 TRINITY_DN12762_c0_g1_i1:49-1665(+)
MDELVGKLKAMGLDIGDIDDATMLKLVGVGTILAGLVALRVVYAVLWGIGSALMKAVNPHGTVERVEVQTTAKPVPASEEPAQQKTADKKPTKSGKGGPKFHQRHSTQKQHHEPAAPSRPAAAPEFDVIPRDGVRVENHTTNFGVVKGFKTPIACTAISTNPESPLMFIGSTDRVYKIMDASTLGTSNDGQVVRIDKATITACALDSLGKCLAVFLDNETKIRVYAVDLKGKPVLTPIWEAPSPFMTVKTIHVGQGGGYVMLLDDKGAVTVMDRRGATIDTLLIPQGSVKQWTFTSAGNLFGLAATMTSSVRLTSVLSASKSTTHEGPLGKGIEVDVFDTASKSFYPAVISEQDSDGTYTVDWRDGTFGYCVSRTHIRTKGALTSGVDYGSMKHVMTLTGHKLNTTCVGFSQDGSRAASCSKDGGVRVWNINVRWHLREEPKLLQAFEDTDYTYFTHAAFSPNNKILVLATPDTSLVFYRIDSKTATILGEITDAHPGLGPLNTLYFTNKSILTTTAVNDPKVKVWDLAKTPYKLELK